GNLRDNQEQGRVGGRAGAQRHRQGERPGAYRPDSPLLPESPGPCRPPAQETQLAGGQHGHHDQRDGRGRVHRLRPNASGILAAMITEARSECTCRLRMEVPSSSDSSVRVWPRYIVAYHVTQPMVLISRAEGSLAAGSGAHALVSTEDTMTGRTSSSSCSAGSVPCAGMDSSESSRPPESIERHARRLFTTDTD